jgi:poly(A) polymerase
VAPDRIRFDNHAVIGARMAEHIGARLRLSKEQIDRVVELVENHMRFADVTRMRPSTLKRFFRLPRFEDHLQLHRLDCRMSHGDLSLYQFCRDQLSKLPEEALRPPRLLSGDDLQRLGYQPGPQFRQMLEAVEDAQLDGSVTTKADAVALVRSAFPPADSHRDTENAENT